MTKPERGALYIIWGNANEAMLQRSIRSLEEVHPGMPYHVARVTLEDPKRGYLEKTKMWELSPFRTTVYLDTDTVVAGNLDFAFQKAEEIGVACCICECPWTRRYGQAEGDNVEYQAGVVFFSERGREVMTTYRKMALDVPATSRLVMYQKLHSNFYDDQAVLARAMQVCRFNPAVLPINYNLRPEFHRSFFTPLKIWHDYLDPPAGLIEFSRKCERGEAMVTYVEL